MKKFGIVLLCALALMVSNVYAQSIQENLEKFTDDYAKGYLNPIFGAFGASLNSGWYNTANVDDEFSLFIGAKIMYLPIPDDAMKFSIASPYDGTIQEVPTVFGEETEVPISGTPPGASPDKYPKGMNLSFMPMVMPHVSVGNMYGTRVMLRYFPTTNIGDFGDFEMLGLGAQHSISRYLPEPLPVDLAGTVAYQSLKLGSFFEATSFTLGAQASKSFPVVDIYAGLAYETASMTIGYDATYTDPNNPSQTITKHYGFDADGENTFRLTGGVSLSLFILKIHADYSLASQSAATLGVGLGW